MPGKTRPYEQFGPFILFKKLESDPLGDLWRAGRIDDRHLGPLVVLRRLTGGNREALAQSAEAARSIAPLLAGTSFVKDQVIDVANGIPYVAHEYGSGRSLRHVIDRARGGAGVIPNPIPIDQAILIAEKVALSLATTADLRHAGVRLAHGGLIPQFIWISDEGDIRVAGQCLGRGLIASLKEGKTGSTFGRYFSPEVRVSGEPTQASEVYAMGAILFLLLTGNEPPDALHVSAFAQSVRAAKTMSGDPLPDDVRAIVDKSLSIDPSRRFGSIGDMKQALSALAHSGKYSATTFNLAFYLSSLLKKEVEGETIEREKESKVNIAPYLEPYVELAPPPLPFAGAKAPKSKTALYASAAVLAIAVAGTGYWMIKPTTQAVAATPKRVATPVGKPVAAAAMILPPTTAASTSVDPAAQKKAFEAAVSQKMQEEMTKLQAEFNKQQKKASPRVQDAPPPVLTASASPQKAPQVVDDRAPSAAALDERRMASRQETTTQPIQNPASMQSSSAEIQPQPQPAAPVVVAPPAIKEGDVVNFDELDERPQVISRPQLRYPILAMRQKVETSLILTVLISETGNVLDVKLLKGDPRFGFNDEATRLLRSTRFRPAMKDGKRVKTWIPQPVDFKLQ